MSSLCAEDDELKAQTKFINALKGFAVKFGAHVICICHPRKEKAGVQISKSSVAGSANIVNLCDSAIVLERPDIRVIKNRDSGVNTLISCCYCGDSRRIYQADKGDLNHYSWDTTGLAKPSPRADSMPEYGVSLAEVAKPAPF